MAQFAVILVQFTTHVADTHSQPSWKHHTIIWIRIHSVDPNPDIKLPDFFKKMLG
jgi:hypothetical protein